MFIPFLPAPWVTILYWTGTYTRALRGITIVYRQGHDKVLIGVILPVHCGQRHAQGHIADPVGHRVLGRDLRIFGCGKGGDEGQSLE